MISQDHEQLLELVAFFRVTVVLGTLVLPHNRVHQRLLRLRHLSQLPVELRLHDRSQAAQFLAERLSGLSVLLHERGIDLVGRRGSVLPSLGRKSARGRVPPGPLVRSLVRT